MQTIPDFIVCYEKTCSFKGEPQPKENFYKSKWTKKGYVLCKKCESLKNKIYREKNKEKLKKYKDEYCKENRDRLNEYGKKYGKKYSKTFAKYKNYKDKLRLYEKVQRDPNDPKLIQVQCANCRNWFNPTVIQILNRIKGINKGINLFYCSDVCKSSCPVFKQRARSKLEDVPSNGRSLQPQLRELVLERDEHTCQICGKTDCALVCHHMTGVMQNPIESADIDNCITLCNICDEHVHSLPGCNRTNLRCQNTKYQQAITDVASNLFKKIVK